PRAVRRLGARAARGPDRGDQRVRQCERGGGGRGAHAPAVDHREAEAGGGVVEPRRHRPVRVHAEHLRRARRDPARGRRRDPAHRRHRTPARPRARLRRGVLGRPVRHRPQVRLPARQHRARARARRPARPARAADGRSRAQARAGVAVALAPLDETRAAILAAVPPLAAADVPLPDAVGLVLAADVVADEPVPPFPNTAMDGYAVRAADTEGASADAPVRLRVVGELPAGRAPRTPVGAGEAIRIMTGAPMPDGADAVVMVERTQRDGDDAVLIGAVASTGDHVRRPGGDLEAGEVAFPAGTVIGPAHVGVLASIGAATVRAYRRARVGVLSTGDELVPIDGGALAPGQIRDSNRPMLLALARDAGTEVVDLGLARDDEDYIVGVLEQAFASSDAGLRRGGGAG